MELAKMLGFICSPLAMTLKATKYKDCAKEVQRKALLYLQ